MNTAIKKSSQASEYVNAVKNKDNLPEDASESEYEQAEIAEIAAFNSFVKFTS